MEASDRWSLLLLNGLGKLRRGLEEDGEEEEKEEEEEEPRRLKGHEGSLKPCFDRPIPDT